MGLVVDLFEIDALGFDGIALGNERACETGADQNQQQKIGADVLEQDWKQKRGQHRANLRERCRESSSHAANRNRKHLPCNQVGHGVGPDISHEGECVREIGKKLAYHRCFSGLSASPIQAVEAMPITRFPGRAATAKRLLARLLPRPEQGNHVWCGGIREKAAHDRTQYRMKQGMVRRPYKSPAIRVKLTVESCDVADVISALCQIRLTPGPIPPPMARKCSIGT